MSGAYEVVGLIRPLTALSLRAGEWVGISTSDQVHFVNVVLHLAAAALVLETLRRLIPMRAAEFAAILFALHPVQAELADAVASRAAVLAALFCLLCLWEWLTGRLWWSVGWFLLAVASREDAALFPLVLLLLHYSGKRADSEWRPLAVMTGVGVGWSAVLLALRGTSAALSESLALLQFILVPVDLRSVSDLDATSVGALIALGAVVIGALAFRGASGGYWLLAGMCLLIGATVLLPFEQGGMERRAYLAMIGFAGAMGVPFQNRRRMWILPIAVLCAGLTVQRQDAWRSKESQAKGEVIRTSKVVETARTLGSTKAIRVLEDAKIESPNDASIGRELGRLYLKLGRFSDSLRESDAVLARVPDDRETQEYRTAARTGLREQYERELRRDPCSIDAIAGLARLGLRVQPPPDCELSAEQRRQLGLD